MPEDWLLKRSVSVVHQEQSHLENITTYREGDVSIRFHRNRLIKSHSRRMEPSSIHSSTPLNPHRSSYSIPKTKLSQIDFEPKISQTRYEESQSSPPISPTDS